MAKTNMKRQDVNEIKRLVATAKRDGDRIDVEGEGAYAVLESEETLEEPAVFQVNAIIGGVCVKKPSVWGERFTKHMVAAMACGFVPTEMEVFGLMNEEDIGEQQ